MRRSAPAVLMALALVCSGTAAAAPATAAATTVSAATLLSRLVVAPESGASSYVRARFAYPVDADHDCQSTRAEVLIQESSRTVAFSSRSHCVVTTGRWTSYYDGVVVTTASALQIDHLVPLEQAWVSGARTWTSAQRTSYANDLAFGPGLVAVTARLNMAKGARDPARWLPPKTGARCLYAVQWVQVKYRWGSPSTPPSAPRSRASCAGRAERSGRGTDAHDRARGRDTGDPDADTRPCSDPDRDSHAHADADSHTDAHTDAGAGVHGEHERRRPGPVRADDGPRDHGCVGGRDRRCALQDHDDVADRHGRRAGPDRPRLQHRRCDRRLPRRRRRHRHPQRGDRALPDLVHAALAAAGAVCLPRHVAVARRNARRGRSSAAAPSADRADLRRARPPRGCGRPRW